MDGIKVLESGFETNEKGGMSEQGKSVVTGMIPVISKITEHKLNGTNYFEWSTMIELYLFSVSKENQLTEDPPTDAASAKEWLRDDAKLFLLITNSIDSEVFTLVNHSEYVKDLMEYLGSLYSGKDNLVRLYDVCKAFCRAEQNGQSLQT